jgi:hypothetical protein
VNESMTSRRRGGELIGDGSELPRPIHLTRRQRKPWRSFEAARRGLGIPATAVLELAGARVLGPAKTQERKREECGPRVSLAARGFL